MENPDLKLCAIDEASFSASYRNMWWMVYNVLSPVVLFVFDSIKSHSPSKNDTWIIWHGQYSYIVWILINTSYNSIFRCKCRVWSINEDKRLHACNKQSDLLRYNKIQNVPIKNYNKILSDILLYHFKLVYL
jgi:hypothetical protein